ncbi:MAG: hypothetical protein LBT37_06140 [Lactobacillaceae bacterium]|jgi:hypothetical protein|nr:hypothetical protein [Lactobacillaceae bacterium]
MDKEHEIEYEKLLVRMVKLGANKWDSSIKKQIESFTFYLLQELDSIDEAHLILKGKGIQPFEQIEEHDRWNFKIGESDELGNFKLPAELITNNKTDLKIVKAERSIYSKIRLLHRHDHEATQYHRSELEQIELRKNVDWAKRFGLTMHQISVVLGEKEEYLNKLSIKNNLA